MCVRGGEGGLQEEAAALRDRRTDWSKVEAECRRLGLLPLPQRCKPSPYCLSKVLAPYSMCTASTEYRRVDRPRTAPARCRRRAQAHMRCRSRLLNAPRGDAELLHAPQGTAPSGNAELSLSACRSLLLHASRPWTMGATRTTSFTARRISFYCMRASHPWTSSARRRSRTASTRWQESACAALDACV